MSTVTFFSSTPVISAFHKIIIVLANVATFVADIYSPVANIENVDRFALID